MADYPQAHALSIDGAQTDEDRDVSFTLTAKDVHPETLALLTGMHPAHFDAEGHALVQGIIDRKRGLE
jgi:hypothetical protein